MSAEKDLCRDSGISSLTMILIDRTSFLFDPQETCSIHLDVQTKQMSTCSLTGLTAKRST